MGWEPFEIKLWSATETRVDITRTIVQIIAILEISPILNWELALARQQGLMKA